MQFLRRRWVGSSGSRSAPLCRAASTSGGPLSSDSAVCEGSGARRHAWAAARQVIVPDDRVPVDLTAALVVVSTEPCHALLEAREIKIRHRGEKAAVVARVLEVQPGVLEGRS